MYIYKEKQTKSDAVHKPDWCVVATDENGQ